MLLLLPQPWHSNQPQLEWLDVSGAQHWRIESRRRLKVAPSPGAGPVNARFFRAWGDRQSVAVVQWYAMPSGGHPSPGHWFWANQWSQLTRRALTPWVAVSLVLPMEPLGALWGDRRLPAPGGGAHRADPAAVDRHRFFMRWPDQ